MALDDRRPLASRGTRWAQHLAQRAQAAGLTPNQISLGSIGFGSLGGLTWGLWGPAAWALVLGAICVQLRLLCNLLDGMVAIEGGQQTPSGALFNEAPDRLADACFLVGLGYASGLPWLGWSAALLAVGTAYVRALGASLGQGQDFSGPLAKPQRMAVITVGALVGAGEHALNDTAYVLVTALWVVVVGTAYTVGRRVHRLRAGLEGELA